MSLIDKLRKRLETDTGAKDKSEIEIILDTKEVKNAITQLSKEGYTYKKITAVLNDEYKSKLKPIQKESRTEATAKGKIIDTRTTSSGSTRYIYEVPARFTEVQVCNVLGIKHPLKK